MPLILVNYDSFYLGLMHFLKACDTNGTLAAPELKDVLLADSNEEVSWRTAVSGVSRLRKCLPHVWCMQHRPCR